MPGLSKINFKSTFNLPNLDFLLKGVKGNGMTLGLTNGTTNAGAFYGTTAIAGNDNIYGTSIGTSQGTSNWPPTNKTIGITTDPTKSGIESEISLNISYAIRY